MSHSLQRSTARLFMSTCNRTRSHISGAPYRTHRKHQYRPFIDACHRTAYNRYSERHLCKQTSLAKARPPYHNCIQPFADSITPATYHRSSFRASAMAPNGVVATDAAVVVFTTSGCPYCRRAKEALTAEGIQYKEVDVSYDTNLRAVLKDTTGSRTVPQVKGPAWHQGSRIKGQQSIPSHRAFCNCM